MLLPRKGASRLLVLQSLDLSVRQWCDTFLAVRKASAVYAALQNRFLAGLSSESRERILAGSSLRRMQAGTLISKHGVQPRYSYFLIAGICSVVLPSTEHQGVEVVLEGNEGVTGAWQMLGPAANPTDGLVQLNAVAFRIRYVDLLALFQQSDEIRSRLLEFTQQEAFTLSLVAGCNRLHKAEARLARWLLMAQDRTGYDELSFTQSFLAQMLGLERTTVSAVAAALQERKQIEYTRGRLTILDRAGLERSACTCYSHAKSLCANLYSNPWK